MSELILPPSCKPNRRAVRLTENFCFLRHKDTRRILCVCYDDAFANAIAATGYEKIPINYANELDKVYKEIREQAKAESEEQEYQQLCREEPVRNELRRQLRAELSKYSGKQRLIVEGTIRALDAQAEKKKRIQETYFYQEAFESGSDAVDLAKKIITNS